MSPLFESRLLEVFLDAARMLFFQCFSAFWLRKKHLLMQYSPYYWCGTLVVACPLPEALECSLLIGYIPLGRPSSTLAV